MTHHLHFQMPKKVILLIQLHFWCFLAKAACHSICTSQKKKTKRCFPLFPTDVICFSTIDFVLTSRGGSSVEEEWEDDCSSTHTASDQSESCRCGWWQKPREGPEGTPLFISASTGGLEVLLWKMKLWKSQSLHHSLKGLLFPCVLTLIH